MVVADEKILIIEDDGDILVANRDLLELAGYRVVTARTLDAGRKAIECENPDLIVLDILLPDGNGLDLCEELRAGSDVRILFLSALNTRADIVEGLRRGGDDYLGKPYLTEEFLLRVQALLRRSASPMPPQTVHTGPFEWQPSAHRAYLDGTDLLLSPREYAILEFLCANRERWLSADEVFRSVWNSDPNGDVHVVHNHISSLRAKLSRYGVNIDSKRGRGYRIEW